MPSTIWKLLIIYHSTMVWSCPDECECKAEANVSCSNKSLVTLPDDINPWVQSLDLSRNAFTSIPSSLSRITSLRVLNLDHNRLNAIGTHRLPSLTQLELLDLSWNAFQRSNDIHTDAFKDFQQLKTLDLSNNVLGTFPHFDSPTVEVLTLINCSISVVPHRISNSFPNLRELNLARNKFPLVAAQFQSPLLSILNLTECHVQQVSHIALNALPALMHLVLKRNYGLKRFEANSTSLKRLDLRDCNLESVPQGSLPNLKTLLLSGNHLRRLESNLFGRMPNLEEVSLMDNSINTIASDAFGKGGNLREVDLSNNPLKTLSGNLFRRNNVLERLNLGRTYIDTMIPLQSLSLVALDLSNCEIREMSWNSLLGMPRLETLSLSGNFLNTLPANVTSLSLVRLNLSGNRLTSLKNSTFRRVPKLTLLNLVGNRLVHLEFYASFKNVRLLFVGDNPWRCECDSRGFEHLYRTLAAIKSDVATTRCQTPSNLEGQTWAEACGDRWFPWGFVKADRTWVASVTIISALLVACCVFACISRECNQRKKRHLEAERERQEAVRSRLVTMLEAANQHRESREEENRNAPDPRELQAPPSYNEAITMPPLGSATSLLAKSSSLHCLNNLTTSTNPKQKTRRRKRSRSLHQMTQTSVLNETNQSNNPISEMSGYRGNNHLTDVTQSNPDLQPGLQPGHAHSAKAKRRWKRSQSRLQHLGNDSSDSSFIETDM